MTQPPPSEPSTPKPTPSAPPGFPTNEIGMDLRENSGQAIAQMNHSRAASVNGTYIENYYSGAPPVSEAPSAPERKTPPLLPYLADRSDQEYRLSKFIQKSNEKTGSGPIVIVIHGDEFQCHLKFWERLRTRSLPRILAKYDNLEMDQVVIQEHPLDWPPGVKDHDELSERLRMDLAETVLNDPLASLEEIQMSFGRFPGVKMISTTLLTSEWKDSPIAVLKSLLEFWQRWPNLLSGQKLIVCIAVKYQLMRPIPKEQEGWLSWLKFWKRWNSFQRRRRCRQLNQTIAREVEDVGTTQFQDYDRLSGIVLPKLTGVSRSHVEAWVRHEAKEFVGEANLVTLLGQVRRMYDALEQEGSEEAMISMEDLANQLIQALRATMNETKGAA